MFGTKKSRPLRKHMPISVSYTHLYKFYQSGELIKHREDDREYMGRTLSLIHIFTSKTTGENHVVVTDDNGQFSTSADWASHKHNTNAGTVSYTHLDVYKRQKQKKAVRC